MSRRLTSLSVLTAAILFVAVPGCSDQREWEVTVENKSAVPCSFAVTLGADGDSKANVDAVTKGDVIKLIGGSGETVVHTVMVVRDRDEQFLTPDAKLVGGKRYAIVVEPDGKLATSIANK